MRKYFALAILFCVTYVSAADVTEIATLTLSEGGKEPLVCVVFMDKNADVKVHINRNEVDNGDNIIEAIQNGTLTYESALELLTSACPALNKTKTHRTFDPNAATAERPDVGNPDSPKTEEGESSDSDTF